MSNEALWTLLDEECALASDRSRGPWNPDALHGGPVAALLARAVEEHGADDEVGWVVARLTIELERPVPVEPLVWEVTTTRPGRKVSLVDVSLRRVDNDLVVARARALRIRQAPVALPYDDPTKAPFLAIPTASAGPDGASPEGSEMDEHPGFHNTATEHRFAEGHWHEPGPVLDWIRLRYPVVAGEDPSPLQRVAAASDFPNGVSHALGMESHLFINPDLTIHLFRPCEGEWVGLQARSLYADVGIGLSDTTLFDRRGQIGSSNQSLLLERR